MNCEEWAKKQEEINQFTKTWPCLECTFRKTKEGPTILDNFLCLDSGSTDPVRTSCEHKTVSPEIRYYLGKYKVRLLPRACSNWKTHSRVFEALEEFPCNAIQMMMEPGEQYMTSTRYLYLNPLNESQAIKEKQK